MILIQFRVSYDLGVMEEEYMNLTIYHSGQFIDDDHSVYEEGDISDLRIDADTWGYFEFVGVLKELGYREFEKI